MFQVDTAFAVELLALVAGTVLLIYAGKESTCCKAWAKIVAYFTLVASILTMLCTFYYTVSYWQTGHFKHPSSQTSCQGDGMNMGHMKGMMGDGMKMCQQGMDCPMMQQMMKNKQTNGPASEGTDVNSDEHSAHH